MRGALAASEAIVENLGFYCASLLLDHPPAQLHLITSLAFWGTGGADYGRQIKNILTF